MRLVLVDACIWVPFFNRPQSAEEKVVDALLDDDGAALIGPFAGAWADRFNRRYTMVTADVLRFGLYASIPIVRTLWWLLVATFLATHANDFAAPAKAGSVRRAVWAAFTGIAVAIAAGVVGVELKGPRIPPPPPLPLL